MLTPKLALIAGLLLLDSCDANTLPTSDQKINQQQETLAREAASEVGMPAIVNFQEKRMAKMIYELRDKAISTTTYIVTLSGQLLKVCDSVGYGLPYSTQYSNPMKPVERSCPGEGCAITAIPQADPNGLFSPADAEGTWVNCLDPKSRDLRVVYLEPRVIVSPFPLTLTDKP